MSTNHLILSVNCGSSSLKLSLFVLDSDRHIPTASQEPVLLATSAISDIGSSHAIFYYSWSKFNIHKCQTDLPSSISDHTAAFEHFLRTLFSDQGFVGSGFKPENITHVCHRVVHGGDLTESMVVKKHTYERLEALSDLAPLHNNHALSIIRSLHDLLPNSKSVAFFDSAFHRTLPAHIYTYPISSIISKEKGLRKYGFHGISYAFLLRSVAAHLNKPVSNTSLIALHLGSGASACAIHNGESVNVSMGLTPVSGLPGGTRSGDVDPSLIFHYVADANVGRMNHDRTNSMHATEAENILNTQAGWRALTGTTDFREIATSPKPSFRLAFDIFVDRISHFVGGYFVQLEGRLDALVFSGGIGENSPELRVAVSHRCACLGFDQISAAKNSTARDKSECVIDIGESGSGTPILVCKTNEELEIARQCALKDEFWD